MNIPPTMPGTELVKFADFSFARLLPSTIAALHAAGYRAAVQCLHASVSPPWKLPARENLDALAAAGAPRAGYIWIRRGQSYSRVHAVREWLGSARWNDLSFVAIDVEREYAKWGLTADERHRIGRLRAERPPDYRRTIRAIKAAAVDRLVPHQGEIDAAVQAVIDCDQWPVYYGNAFWQSERRFRAPLAACPLWVSRWPDRYAADRMTPTALDAAISARRSFPGWTAADAWQFAGDFTCGGITIDGNVSRQDLWLRVMPAP